MASINEVCKEIVEGVSGVEKRLSQQRGQEVKNTMQEIQMTTEKTYHFMSIIPGKPDALAVLITWPRDFPARGRFAVVGRLQRRLVMNRLEGRPTAARRG